MTELLHGLGRSQAVDGRGVEQSGEPRFYGVVSGLSTTTLVGEGWAVGVMSRHPLV